MKPIRLAIAGMHIESGTFSPLTTKAEDFLATRGEQLMDRYPFLEDRSDLADNIEWIPLVHFRAMPGGVVTAEAYQTMKGEILNRLREAGEIDGFYYDIHGAMSVENVDDAELDLLLAIREVLRADVPVSCSQDLHGNVSAELIENLQFITAYRTAPHIDFMETRERAMERLVEMVRSNEHPVRAWIGIPVLLSGEMTSTEVDPGKALWADLTDHIDGDNVWDVSLWAGYPWADQARAMASVVVSGMNRDQVIQAAEDVAASYWNARNQFQFLSPAMDVEAAFEHLNDHDLPLPVFLSDAGDNPTAGGAGDTTEVLGKLLEWSQADERSAIFASIPDQAAVEQCASVGVGGEVSLCLGGKLDTVHSKPHSVTGTVRTYSERDARLGPEAVVDVGGGSIILSSHRRPYHKRDDFTGLGIDPMECEVTVVKIGYLEPELKAMAGSHILLLSDGGVNPDLTSVDYYNIQRPMFPWDKDFEWQPQARVFSSYDKSS
ncbi:M81 family metallopeptidase [Oceaniferula spumae]